MIVIRKVARAACVGICFSALVACFDIEQTLVIHDDQSAAFNFVFTVDFALLELGEGADIDLESACDSEDTFPEELPGALTREADVRIEEAQLICEYTISGPLADFDALSADVQRDMGDMDLISLEILDRNRARIVSVYDFSDDDIEGSAKSSVSGSLRRMIASNFEGRAIRWTIKAPTILESNGEISPDGRSVHWVLPLEQAIGESGRYAFEAIIDYSAHQPRFF